MSDPTETKMRALVPMSAPNGTAPSGTAPLGDAPEPHHPPALPKMDASLTVTGAEGRVVLDAQLRRGKPPSVRLHVDGMLVHVDALDLQSSRARERFVKAAPTAWSADVTTGLLSLASRASMAPDRDGTNNTAVFVPPVEPCVHDVDPASVLDSVAARVLRHVQLPAAAADVIPLWIALTYLADELPTAPLLWIYSPTRGCGKSVLLDAVMLLAARSLKADNATLAVLFRVAESHRATIGLDEIDQWLTGDKHEEISGLLNASFARGGMFLRTVGDNHEPKGFNVFGFRVVAGIGQGLHDTTRSRAVRVHMTRASATALPEPLQGMYADPWAVPLRQQLARLAEQVRDVLTERLRDATGTPYPAHLDGRARDLWLPLLALADVVGGVWPARVRTACSTMSREAAEDVVDIGELLLLDCRQFFTERGGAESEPADLLRWLVGKEGAIWAEVRRGGKPLTAAALAKRLGDFGIKSEHRRGTDGKNARWLHPSQFTDAWTRYLPAVESGTAGTPGTAGTDGTLSQTHAERKMRVEMVRVTTTNGVTFDTTADDPSLIEMPELIAHVEPLAA